MQKILYVLAVTVMEYANSCDEIVFYENLFVNTWSCLGKTTYLTEMIDLLIEYMWYIYVSEIDLG